MSTNVNKVYKGVQYLANKSQRGGYISPLEFNREAPIAFYEVINDRYTNLSEIQKGAQYPVKGIQQTERSSDSLSELFKTKSIAPDTSGKVSKPDDYMHLLRFYSNSVYTLDGEQYTEEVEVDEVIKSALTKRKNSLVQPISPENPIYSTYNTYFQVYPKNLSLVFIDYIKQPSPPVWDYDLSSGVPVFAEAGSTITTNTTDPITGETISVPRTSQSQDFEMGEEEISTIITAICKRLAINIREVDLYNYMDNLKQTS